MALSEFDANSRTFLEWFNSQAGATFHPDIKITDLRNRRAGRGIVATADIPEDTILFAIPRDAIINVLTSELPRKIPQIFKDSIVEPVEHPNGDVGGGDDDDDDDTDYSELNGPPDSWLSLILVLIYEYLQGGRSQWRPYFDILPQDFSTLMFWHEEDLRHLQTSVIRTRIGKEDADGTFRTKILPVIQEYADIFYPEDAARLSDDQLMALAHRMGSTIMAYAFDLENNNEEPDNEEDDEWVEDREGKIMMGMVPMADILNADASFNAHVNHEDEMLTVVSLRPIAAGHEILNYYGPLSNGELLRRYGYVTKTHARYDAVEVSWESILLALKEHLKVDDAAWNQAVNKLKAEEIEDTFIIERNVEEPNRRGEVPGHTHLNELPTDLLRQIMTLLKAVRDTKPDSVPSRQAGDSISLAVLRRVLEVQLAGYATSLETDLNLLAMDEVAGRERMATVVRSGEKKLLTEAINLTADRIVSRESDSTADAMRHAAKRQKTF